MAHGITSTDTPIYARKPAWHGLGTVLEEAPSIDAALQIAGLDWSVDQWPISATNGEVRRIVESHVLNVRSDNASSIGVVGSGYRPVQNRELVDFAKAIAAESDVLKVESAGSLWGGSRVWFLLRGESFTLRSSDEVRPYLLLANGHDGSLAFRAIPTSIRVECNNKLSQALRVGEKIGYTFRHTGSVSDKMEEARKALKSYTGQVERFTEACKTLAGKGTNTEEVKAFFTECYQDDFGAIPAEVKNDADRRKRDTAKDAFHAYVRRFDREITVAGATRWNMANAYTGFLQHDRKVRAANESDRRQYRVDYALFGADAERSTSAFSRALTMA